MGFVRESGGEARSFSEIKQHIPKVREAAIMQFLHLLKKFAGVVSEDHLWGDETEFHIVHLDKHSKKARICLKGKEFVSGIEDELFEAQYEFGSWMVEGVPKNPYHIKCDPEEIRRNIQARRQGIEKHLDPDEFILSCPIFPLLGIADFYRDMDEEYKDQHSAEVEATLGLKKMSAVAKSSVEQQERKGLSEAFLTGSEKHFMCMGEIVPDYLITSHPRYITLARNILLRKGSKPHIKAPIYKDVNTSMEPTLDEPFPGYIFMDCLIYAFGNCCLQQTFAAKGYHEARYLYDQLGILSPLVVTNIMLIF